MAQHHMTLLVGGSGVLTLFGGQQEETSGEFRAGLQGLGQIFEVWGRSPRFRVGLQGLGQVSKV